MMGLIDSNTKGGQGIGFFLTRILAVLGLVLCMAVSGLGHAHGGNNLQHPHNGHHIHNQYDAVYNGHHVRGKREFAPLANGAKCPVCQMAVTESSPYVSMKHDNQRVYVCSEDHGKQYYEDPKKFMNVTATDNSNNPNTPVDPAMECMFCGMPAMDNQDVILDGGQTLYACTMNEDYVSLKEGGADLISTFDGVFNVQNQLVYPAASPSSQGFCQGRGTVMLNGFSTGSVSCVIYLAEAWVLDETWKYALAIVGTLLLASLVQILAKYRSVLEVNFNKQAYTEGRVLHLTEGAIISGILFLCVTMGYFLMLLTMTYDIGLFFAVVAGLGLGHFAAFLIFRSVDNNQCKKTRTTRMNLYKRNEVSKSVSVIANSECDCSPAQECMDDEEDPDPNMDCTGRPITMPGAQTPCCSY